MDTEAAVFYCGSLHSRTVFRPLQTKKGGEKSPPFRKALSLLQYALTAEQPGQEPPGSQPAWHRWRARPVLPPAWHRQEQREPPAVQRVWSPQPGLREEQREVLRRQAWCHQQREPVQGLEPGPPQEEWPEVREPDW